MPASFDMIKYKRTEKKTNVRTERGNVDVRVFSAGEMIKKIKKFHSSMAASIVGSIVILMAVFSIAVSTIGVAAFSSAFNKEYSYTTYHMADAAASLVNGNHIEEYLTEQLPEEYRRIKNNLNVFCRRMNVSLVYVIAVDTSDYGRFTSVFNSVNNTVDDTEYKPWKVGYQRDTTNEEYRERYRQLYEKEITYATIYRTKPGEGYHPHITTIVPIKDALGKVSALMCIQRPMNELYTARRKFLVNTGVLMVILAIFASLIAAGYFRKQFVLPVRKTSEEANRFAKENTKGEPLAGISRFDEIKQLVSSINTMETDMVSYIENLTVITAERERIGAELSLARTIQENAIPNVFPPFPDRRDLDIYASMTPAKEVGGDFYNFFFIDEDHLAIVIGDVSGKGIAAALFMMVTNILIKDRAAMFTTPAEILTSVNKSVCENNQAEMFITVWLGILEMSTGKLTFSNAGHEDAAVCPKGGSFRINRNKHDLVVGAMDSIRYHNLEMVLEKGDKLFVFTDGVSEATDEDNNLFTTGRMLDALNENREKTPEEILKGIHRSVDDFVGEAPQFDDLTMLCVERR